MNPEPDAIVHLLQVPLPPAQAFDLFVHQMSRWWPLSSHSCSGDRYAKVSVQPGVGGAVTELAPDGVRHCWGTLTAWDPPRHFAMTWHPGQPSEQATRLSVRFIDHDAGCTIELRHDGWGARGSAAAKMRDQYQTGWAQVLGLYALSARNMA